MKRKIYLFIGLIMAAALGSCALLALPSDVTKVPPPIKVNGASRFFLDVEGGESITFTGDPEADFGGTTNRLLLTDTNDFSNAIEITQVYLAFTSNTLYIGHKSASNVATINNNGAFYIYFDNGVPGGKGINICDASGLSAGGITGAFDFLDDTGISTTNTTNHQITGFTKHWRPAGTFIAGAAGEDFKAYFFPTGVVIREQIKGGDNTAAWAKFLTNNVTEIAIPLRHIYGSEVGSATALNLVFRVDDGAAGTFFPGADWAPDSATGDEIQDGAWITVDINP